MRSHKLYWYIKRPVVFFLVLLLTLTTLITINPSPVTSTPDQGVRYFADVIKYPLPGIPEPVLDGSEFTVQVKLPEGTTWYDAIVFNKLAATMATLVSEEYDPQNELWTLKFDLPSGLREGAYSLNLTYSPAADGAVETLTQLRCLWVLPEWPQKLKILACGDVKDPGYPYWKEMAIEANLIDPDVIIFLGDLVNVPYTASGWIKFQEPFIEVLDPIYVNVGNHEYSSVGVAEEYNRIIGPVNYTVTIGDFLLLSLDTDFDGWVRMDRLRWAEQVLKENSERTKILSFHHPLFSPQVKDLPSALFNVSSWKDFDSFLDQGFIYSSWADHPDEAREMFRLIIEYDVRLILSEHIHTDLNVIVKDTTTGKKHYFISPAALALDIPPYDYRGFKLIDIYVNGTVDESTLYYNGTGMFSYPNSIPVDSGWGAEYEPHEPYKIGFLEYYYAPANDGKHHAVSFRAKNELNQLFYNVRIIFKLPTDIPVDDYEWLPYKPEYEVVEKDDAYYVILRDVAIPARSTLSFTVKSVDDMNPPTINLIDVPELAEPSSWLIFNVEAEDQDWGVSDIEVTYSVNGENWVEPDMLDLVGWGDGKVTYVVWIKTPNLNATMKIRASAKDFAGHVSEEAMTTITVGTPSPPPTEGVAPSALSWQQMLVPIVIIAVVIIVMWSYRRAKRR